MRQTSRPGRIFLRGRGDRPGEEKMDQDFTAQELAEIDAQIDEREDEDNEDLDALLDAR